jgi:hypothetical protein
MTNLPSKGDLARRHRNAQQIQHIDPAQISGHFSAMANESTTSATPNGLLCKRCATENSTRSRFCSACGAPLGPEWEALERTIDDRLTNKIRATLKQDFADQKALEIETAALVAERALKWAKTFGFFIGIPVVLAVAFFGFIGIKTWSDISSAKDKIATASADLGNAQKQLEATNLRTKEINSEADTAQRQFDAFMKQLADARINLASIPELQRRQSELEADVKDIKNFTLRDSVPIQKDQVAKMDALLDSYKKHLVSIGVKLPGTLPSLRIEDMGNSASKVSYYVSGAPVGSDTVPLPASLM